ncbi:hypothetical protein ACIP4W_39025 [Streptomyces sp. NPDC088846]|uniref:hypothetical protein n=1 Tax=Streptomyces sp. NPDC088846 TaxID=3365908 RepID=UPI00380D6A66
MAAGSCSGRVWCVAPGTDRLERLGHLDRTRDARDRRRVLLSVTPRAVELGQFFFRPLIENTVAVLPDFDESETAAVRRFLDTAHRAVTAPPPPAPGTDAAPRAG